MRSRRKVAFATVVTGAALLTPALPAASAATTDQIVQDAKDGQIDGSYSGASLDAALSSPLLKTYGGVAGVQAVKSALGANTVNTVTTSGSGELPFTGAEMITFAVLGSTLFAAGFITRRGTRPGQADDDV
jgi:hypothetical protein